MTHAELVQRAAKWLKGQRYRVVFTEMTTPARETPDAIGFNSGGVSCLIECKTSLADFKREKHKHFRRWSEMGIGCKRYYFCEKDLISADNLFEGWGLLYFEKSKDRIKKVVESKNFQKMSEGLRSERKFLVSILRRIDIQWGLHNIKSFLEFEKNKGGKHDKENDSKRI